jgi:glucose/mannose-6-phosphate isomerase
MINSLDSREFVVRNDPKGMYDLTVAFAMQCRHALEITQTAGVSLSGFKPNSIVVTGLGGSAAGGDVVRAIMEAEGSIPLIVNRDYHLPGFVNESTLVFATSYSGNTEETLSAYADAKKAGAKIVGVTSGGKLAEMCKQDGNPCVLIPAGQPPRTALGYLTIPVLAMCEQAGYLPNQQFEKCFSLLETCATDWRVEAKAENNPTKQLAAQLHGTFPILYGLGNYQGVAAYRWKGQINENAKNMTYSHTLPEMNHNEVLGWVLADQQGVAKYNLVILQDGHESAKMKARARVTTQLVGDKASVRWVIARGETLLERCLSLIYFGDFVSLYLAALNDVDPENIDSINILKAELAKVS